MQRGAPRHSPHIALSPHFDSQVTGRVKSGQGQGTVGHLSRGLVSRAEYYRHACIMALLPFMNPELYGQQYDLGGGIGRGS